MKKICNTCKEIKVASEFYADVRTKKDGLMGSCKSCHAIKVRECQDKDGGTKHKERAKEWKTKNRQKARESAYEWRRKNSDLVKKYSVISKARRIESVYSMNRERTMSMRLATPKWANVFFIEEIYDLARLRSKVTGIKWHVDHFIPLRGKAVCGLHVESNLRVVPATVNLRKGRSLPSAIS